MGGAGAGGDGGDGGGNGDGGSSGSGGGSGHGGSAGDGAAGGESGSSGSGGMGGESGSGASGGSGGGESRTFGFVRDTETVAGISGAEVSFRRLLTSGSTSFQFGDFLHATTVNDPSGYYVMTDAVEAGWQSVWVTAPGFTPGIFYRNHQFRALCDGAPCASQTFYLFNAGTVHDKLPDLITDARLLLSAKLTNSCDDVNEVSACLRAAIATANVGEGDIWLTAPQNTLDQVTQHLYRTDDTVTPVLLPDAHFIHHKEHGHIHFDGWSGFSLRAIDDTCDTEATAENCLPLKNGTKISFCVRDSLTVDSAFSPMRSYDCSIDSQGRVSQGIGAGKADLYDSSLKGQFIDVTGLPHGDYWLEAHVNADRVVLERDYTNNVSRVRIRLELPECGNGVIENPESCEGTDLDGMTCKNYSAHYSGGTLKCNATCGFDRSECERAECNPLDLGRAVGASVASGSNTALYDTLDTFLCENTRGTGRDASFLWTAPESAEYTFRTAGSTYDTMLYILDGACGGEELVCDGSRGDSTVKLQAVQGRKYVIVLDAHPAKTGNYVLGIEGPP